MNMGTTYSKAIIIGNGVAGPVLAMALRQIGIEAEIHEAYDGPGDHAGLFLNAASNGLDVLHQLDAHHDVVSAGWPCPRLQMFSGTGKRLGEVSNGLPPDKGLGSVLIKRGTLQHALREAAAQRGIAVRYGARLTDLDQRPDGVTARFDDGSSADGDILVGCDGLHSATRHLIDPAAPSPSYTGMLCFGGFAHGTSLEATPGTLNLMFGRRAFFGWLVAESGEVYWFSNVARRDEPTHAELTATPTETWRRHLLELHRGDAAPVEEILSAPQDEIAVYPLHDMPPVPTWYRGRVAIIGDAAHATSPHAGQGASLAIEDALVLARCLRNLGDAALAFPRFDALRRERVEKVVKFARQMGHNKTNSSRIGLKLRDATLPFVLKHFATPEARAWIYTYKVDWNRSHA
jgi:2-polyprenyl-6-methoxyphenol hydroxylase-like FAD-dependent oxidoreductase